MEPVLGGDYVDREEYEELQEHISELEREKQMYKNALETSLTIANTTAANLHDVIRDRDKRIAELEAELADKQNWSTTIRNLEADNARLREALKRLEWSDPAGFLGNHCPACGGAEPGSGVVGSSIDGHASDCWLAAELEGK
jgi:DNA repair exonuclease SbcCD ATPase subunit